MQKHATQYPVLARMVWDYLPIQGLATPSECAFSSASFTDTKHHNWLAPDTFEALQILKSVYCNGHISVPAKAEKYFDSIISVLGGDAGDDRSVDGPASSFF